MIDVILYGYDADGRLTLREASFRSLRDLADFFGSGKSIRWEWAELHDRGQEGDLCVARYSADELRRLTEADDPDPRRN